MIEFARQFNPNEDLKQLFIVLVIRLGPNLFSVENQLVVVTGGLGLLGREFALALIDLGAHVAVFDQRAAEKEALRDLAKSAREKGLPTWSNEWSVTKKKDEHYHAVHPPSMIRLEPVMYADASETRNTMAPLYSFALAIRPIGTRVQYCFMNSAS